jgi:hypothetical protein
MSKPESNNIQLPQQPQKIHYLDNNGVDILYNKNITASSSQFISDEAKEIVPLMIKKKDEKKSSYFVFVDDKKTESESTIQPEIGTKYENVNTMNKNEISDKKPKMDYLTQFYVGSLTVVGLYVFYRLLKKAN